jgi:hypothetical protein
LLTDLTEARPLIRTELNAKTLDGGQRIAGLVNCVAAAGFLSKDFVRRFFLPTRNKSKVKTLFRFANGQRVTSSTVCEITPELARHEFQRKFYVLRDLRVVDMVLGLSWLNDEQASLQFGTTRVFVMMDGRAMEIQT